MPLGLQQTGLPQITIANGDSLPLSHFEIGGPSKLRVKGCGTPRRCGGYAWLLCATQSGFRLRQGVVFQVALCDPGFYCRLVLLAVFLGPVGRGRLRNVIGIRRMSHFVRIREHYRFVRDAFPLFAYLNLPQKSHRRRNLEVPWPNTNVPVPAESLITRKSAGTARFDPLHNRIGVLDNAVVSQPQHVFGGVDQAASEEAAGNGHEPMAKRDGEKQSGRAQDRQLPHEISGGEYSDLRKGKSKRRKRAEKTDERGRVEQNRKDSGFSLVRAVRLEWRDEHENIGNPGPSINGFNDGKD